MGVSSADNKPDRAVWDLLALLADPKAASDRLKALQDAESAATAKKDQADARMVEANTAKTNATEIMAKAIATRDDNDEKARDLRARSTKLDLAESLFTTQKAVTETEIVSRETKLREREEAVATSETRSAKREAEASAMKKEAEEILAAAKAKAESVRKLLEA